MPQAESLDIPPLRKPAYAHMLIPIGGDDELFVRREDERVDGGRMPENERPVEVGIFV